MAEHTIVLDDGRVLRAHDTGSKSGAATILWHHGSPQTGALLPPVVAAAAAVGARLVSYGRPGYGGSTAAPGRDVAAAARDVAAVLDALGVRECAMLGASGGGPHALAGAALLPDRVRATVCLAGLAPPGVDIDWFAGMHSETALRVAGTGRAARAALAEVEEFDPACFTDEDWALLEGPWACLGEDSNLASADGPGGLVDDDVAFARPWGFDPVTVRTPVLLVHGTQDRVVPVSHSRWLARTLPAAELWERPRDGHVSVLGALPAATAWAVARLS